MTFGDWIAGQRRARGLSQAAFAIQSSLSPKVVQLIESGGTLEGRNESTKTLLARGLGMTLDELLGVERMIRETGSFPTKLIRVNDDGIRRAVNIEELGRKGIPVRGEVTAGALVEQFDSTQGDNTERIAFYLDGYPDAFAVKVRGTSMHPIYSDGDFVVVSPARVESIKPGRDYYVQLSPKAGNTSTLKKAFPIGNGELILMPIGQGHTPFTVDMKDVRAAYRVLGRWTPME